MVVCTFRDLAFVLAFAPIAAAMQDAPPAKPADNPPAKPAKKDETAPSNPQPAQTGPTRHKIDTKVGAAVLQVDHGQPPWSDERLGAMAQIPPGVPWRMGSDETSTLDVKDAPIFFGPTLVEPGHYGINLLHVAENAWNFLLFDDKNVGNPGTFNGTGATIQIPTTYKSDATPSIERLTLELLGSDGDSRLELQWGPLRVVAPVAGMRPRKTELELNGSTAEATWFERTLPSDVDPSKPQIAGRLALELDGEDCGMTVYVQQSGDKLVALFRNSEREQWERENAQLNDTIKRFDQIIQQGPPPQVEEQLRNIMAAARRTITRNEVQLEDSVSLPDNLTFEATAYDGTGKDLRVETAKTRSGTKLDVFLAGKRATIGIDDSRFVVRSSG